MQVNGNYSANPNYQSSFRSITYKQGSNHDSHEQWVGSATNFAFRVFDTDYEQANGLWQVLGRTPGQQDNFVHNVSVHLKGARSEVRERTYGMFGKVAKELGERIKMATEENVKKDEELKAKSQPRL
jgi:catalase